MLAYFKTVDDAANAINSIILNKIVPSVLDIMDKITMAEQILDDTPRPVKKLKKDKGFIERTESSKTILTEDNKELLMD